MKEMWVCFLIRNDRLPYSHRKYLFPLSLCWKVVPHWVLEGRCIIVCTFPRPQRWTHCPSPSLGNFFTDDLLHICGTSKRTRCPSCSFVFVVFIKLYLIKCLIFFFTTLMFCELCLLISGSSIAIALLIFHA